MRRWVLLGVNIVLGGIVILLSILLFQSLMEPVRMHEEIARRQEKVIQHLKALRTAQFLFRAKYNRFTASEDTLLMFLKRESLEVVRVTGNPDDTAQQVRYDTVWVAVMDTFRRQYPELSLDSLFFIPYGGGKKFEIQVGAVERGRVKVPVFLIRANPEAYLEGLPDRYVQQAEPLYVGSLQEPTYSGNWE